MKLELMYYRNFGRIGQFGENHGHERIVCMIQNSLITTGKNCMYD